MEHLLLFQSEISSSWVTGIGIAVAGFSLTSLGALIAFIRWGIALEAVNARQSERCDRLEVNLKEYREKTEHHMFDNKVHFNSEVSRQVDEKNNQRFKHIEDELNEINGKLDTLMDRNH